MSAQDPNLDPVTDSDTNTVPITQTPSIDVVKANGGVVDLDSNGDDAGDQIVYNYSVTNDGNVTLYDVSLSDDQLGAITLTGLTDEDGDGTADDLAVDATVTGTASDGEVEDHWLPGAPLFADDFETGNTSRWSATVPSWGYVRSSQSKTTRSISGSP